MDPLLRSNGGIGNLFLWCLGMHELSVTEQLLGIVLDHARKAEAKRVLKVNLVIGELTGFVRGEHSVLF